MAFRVKRADGSYFPKWKFHYRDFEGRQRNATGAASKKETDRLAAEVQAHHDMIRRGMLPRPTPADTAGGRPVGEVVEEYIASKQQTGGRRNHPTSKVHLREIKTNMAWWMNLLHITELGELDGCLSRVEQVLRTECGELAPKTCSNRVNYLRAFIRWCNTHRYMLNDPIEGLAKFSTEPTVKRRALTEAEIEKVLGALPDHHRLLFEVALTTGLRRRELALLSREHMHDGALHLESSMTKNRRAAVVRLPVWLYAKLERFSGEDTAASLYARYGAARQQERASDPLLFVPTHISRTFQSACKQAGVEQQNFFGKTDFHGLRTTFISLINARGAGVRETMELARHGSAAMTFDVYARGDERRKSELVEAVGDAIRADSGTESVLQEPARKAAGAESLDAATTYDADDWWRIRDSNLKPTGFSGNPQLALTDGKLPKTDSLTAFSQHHASAGQNTTDSNLQHHEAKFGTKSVPVVPDDLARVIAAWPHLSDEVRDIIRDIALKGIKNES